MKTEITDVLAAKQVEGAILEQAVADDEMQRGIDAAQAGDKATAHQIFQKIAARNPGSIEAWIWLGGTSPNLDEAEAAFEKAHELDPVNEEAILGMRWIVLRRQSLRQTGGLTSGTLSTGALGSNTATLSTGQLAPMAAAPTGILAPPSAQSEPAPAEASRKSGPSLLVMVIIVLLVIALAGGVILYALGYFTF